ncbi:MAG TPA: hypothetical protein VFN26_00245 [Candidatus Acidoferrum sp.]|nr:hypothetical protein [Candidatus Acidoferrum sp.]
MRRFDKDKSASIPGSLRRNSRALGANVLYRSYRAYERLIHAGKLHQHFQVMPLVFPAL